MPPETFSMLKRRPLQDKIRELKAGDVFLVAWHEDAAEPWALWIGLVRRKHENFCAVGYLEDSLGSHELPAPDNPYSGKTRYIGHIEKLGTLNADI